METIKSEKNLELPNLNKNAASAKKYLQCLMKIRKIRNKLQVERLILENKLKELKSPNRDSDTKENVKHEESPTDAALKMMQSSMEVKNPSNKQEFDIEAFCNSQELNLHVGSSNTRADDQHSDEDDEEFDDDDDEDDDDPEEFVIDMNMYMNGM